MRRIVLLAFIVSLALSCMGQTTPLGVTLLASDGNLYGLDESLGFFSYNLTTGASTILNSKYTTQNTTLCLERPDGTLLAIYQLSDSTFTAVSLTLAGVSTTLATFPPGYPACPAMANDGNYYGASGSGGKYGNGYLYQLGSNNVITDFYDFTGGVDGSAPLFSSPVQGSDGNLYFTDGTNLLRYSTTAGAVPLSTGYPLSRGSILEGADGNFYSTSVPEDTGGYGSQIVQIQPSGTTTAIDTDESYDQFQSLYLTGQDLALLYDYEIEIGDCSQEVTTEFMSGLTLNGAGTDIGINFDDDNGQEGDDATLFLGGNGTFYGTLAYSTASGVYPDCNYGGSASTVALPTTLTPMQMTLSKTHVLQGGTATLTWDVNDAFSDTMQQCYGYGGLSGKLATSGSATVTAKATGPNVSAIVCGGTQTDFVTLTAGAATVGLTASAGASTTDPAGIGLPVTLTATITNAGTDAPTGTVKFLYGSTVLGSAALKNGSASFTASTTGLAPGTYNITASYAGDGNYGPATSAVLPITIANRTATTATLTPASQTLVVGSNAIFTATVTGSSKYGYPSGSIELLDGTTALLTVPLQQYSETESVASISASSSGIAPGTYPVHLSYPGDNANLPSTSATASVTVLAQTVFVTASPNPVPATSNFTLTATVKGSVTPTGSVIFEAGTQDLGSTTLNSSGVGTITLPSGTLAAGTYSVTAHYAGDSHNPAGTSSPVSLVVQ
jgi:hypothetical protein